MSLITNKVVAPNISALESIVAQQSSLITALKLKFFLNDVGTLSIAKYPGNGIQLRAYFSKGQTTSEVEEIWEHYHGDFPLIVANC